MSSACTVNGDRAEGEERTQPEEGHKEYVTEEEQSRRCGRDQAEEQTRLYDQEEGEDEADNEELEKQKEQYAKKGMTLAEIESPAEPHFVNIDEGE